MPFLGSIFQRLRSESLVLDVEGKEEHKWKKRSRLFSSHPASPRRSGVDSIPLFTTPTPPASSRLSTKGVPDQPCLPIYESFTIGKHRSIVLENWRLQDMEKRPARRLSRIATISDFHNLGHRNSQSVGEDTARSSAAGQLPAHGQTPDLGRYYRSLLPDARIMWDEDGDENAGDPPLDSQQNQQDSEPDADSTDSSPPLVPQEEAAEHGIPEEDAAEEGVSEEDTAEESVPQVDTAEESVPRTSLAESGGPSPEATRTDRAGSCASLASTEAEVDEEEACVFSWERTGPARCVRVRSDDGWPLWPGTAPAAGSSVGDSAVGPATDPVVGPWVARSLGPAAGPFPWSPAPSTAGSDDSGVAAPPTPPPKSAKRLSRAAGKRLTSLPLAGRVKDAGRDSVGLQICSELLTDQLTKAVVSSGQKDTTDKAEEQGQAKKKLQVLLMIEAYEGMLRSVRGAGGGVEEESRSVSASGSGDSAGSGKGEDKRKTMVQMVPVLEHWLDALHAVYDEALQGDDGDE